ncbi:hypothetical protein Desor_3267 [Desulfosporosinus orientis DSM 765]|uniref:Uncharacterized protein n=1 Tax=Desulfosporosinus orientis (strain ATCC 19365 / DSM 765 / NCIMB 8382 / VKM B-1628 / Singapore I) TaxID=768706 RepID=G7WBL2_DESOD|nr:hypothetical protein [Desulfosporosinus orientis]AET68770.1 hypothetical protein Desor_3267 [Desulfosporosinus orientis DSM 765]
METYYHNNPKIEEWTEQIIEKILTVCILSGSDSNSEYQKGCQLIAKITALLQGFSSLPAEYLADGLKQIIEQQLPDPRVINNFPAFHNTMNRMIKEGMLTVVGDLEIETVQLELTQAQPALALVHQENEKVDRLVDSGNQKLAELIENIPDTECIDGETNALNQTQLYRERIKKTLPHLFPKETIQWDVTLLSQTFLAQLNDILIYCADMDQKLNKEIYFKDGWKVMVVGEEELAYPRRLERELKNLMRIGKKIK